MDRAQFQIARGFAAAVAALACVWFTRLGSAHAQNVHLLDVPDYAWHVGCFGTATGNLMGYWDRHGFPNFYTGPTANGVAPLNSFGANRGITSMWATKAGLDGRPADRPGHEDDYYIDYESAAPDPFVTRGRPEHPPDCIGDFIGLNQRKWTDLNGECQGNIDGFSFVYWDASGARRLNYTPSGAGGQPMVDIQSGLRAWTRWRGDDADVFTQLADFNPAVPVGQGFTFEDLRREIDAGYPVLLFMQPYGEFSRAFPGMPRANPNIHGMLAYGYLIASDGTPFVRFRTSWASGDNEFAAWAPENWTPQAPLELPLRGVIGYRPRPRITAIERNGGGITIRWQGPASRLLNADTGEVTSVHRYVVERANAAQPTVFEPVTEPLTESETTISDCCGAAAFFRLKLETPP